MRIPFWKKISAGLAESVFNDSTVRRAELMRQFRPRDIAAIAGLDRAIGVTHQCASTNADVCSSIPLRLMRRVDAADSVDRRAYSGRKIAKIQHKYMASGQAGVKVAAFADSGGEVEEVTDHPILDLLENPNPDYPGSQIAWLSFYFKEITGKSYELVAFGENDMPVVLYPLLSQYTMPVIGEESGAIEGFRYSRSETSVAEFEAEDVIYYRHRVSRFDPNGGEGPLVGVLAEADLLMKSLILDIAMADGGNRPDSLWTIKDGMATPDQVKDFEKKMRSKFRGLRGMSKPLVTRGDVTVQPLAWPEKELQSFQKIEAMEKRIRSAFGHPESMGDSNASTYAAALIAENEYAKNTLLPRLNADAAQKNTSLLPMFGLDPSVYCLVYDNPVKKDEAALSDRMRLDVASGVRTINEARSEQGLDPSDDEGADMLRVNGQTFEKLDAEAQAPTLGGFTLNAAPEAKAAEPVTVPEKFDLLPVLRKSVKAGELQRWTDCECEACTKAGDIADDPIIEDVFSGALEPVEESMEEILTEMQDEVVQAAGAGRASDLEDLKAQAAAVLQDQMEDVVLDSVRATLAAANQDVDSMFDVVNETALSFLERHTIQVADDIAATTETMIRPAIERGLEEGLSIGDIAAQIESENIPAYRAERIARTEVQTAVQGARYETLGEIGVETVDWVNAPGASAAHQQIAARSPKKMGEPFVKAGETIGKESFDRDIYHPPARPNCRCSLRGNFDDLDEDE